MPTGLLSAQFLRDDISFFNPYLPLISFFLSWELGGIKEDPSNLRKTPPINIPGSKSEPNRSTINLMVLVCFCHPEHKRRH